MPSAPEMVIAVLAGFDRRDHERRHAARGAVDGHLRAGRIGRHLETSHIAQRGREIHVLPHDRAGFDHERERALVRAVLEFERVGAERQV